MKRLLLVVLVMMILLAGCTRRNDTELTPVTTPFGGVSDAPPTPTLEPLIPDVMGTRTAPVEGEPGTEVEPLPTQDPLAGGRFTELRFATSGEGVAQANFPEGTEEIYAIWNYDGMKAGDTMERVWYLNDQEYVSRSEEWDFLKYGFSGSVRDIYLYDYIDGIDPGSWRVELFLNGEQQLIGTFTVGGP